jgi:c-opsin
MCITTGFFMYFVGCSSIYIMCAISYERFYIVHRIEAFQKLNQKYCMMIIAMCFALSLFWTSMPLFGWSFYSLESAGTSCSVEWNVRSVAVTSYNTVMFTFVFFIPLMFILVTNLKLLFKVSFFFKS